MLEKIKCFLIGVFAGILGILGGILLYKRNSTSDFGKQQQDATDRVETERRKLESDKRRLEENESILSEVRNNQKLVNGYNSSIHGNYCDFIRKRNSGEIK